MPEIASEVAEELARLTPAERAEVEWLKSRPSPEQIGVALCLVGRPAMLRVFGPDSCIAAARIAVDVYRHFGYAAEPLGVRVFIANAAWAQAVKDKWPGFDPTDAKTFMPELHTIGLGHRVDAERAGHVVVLCESVLVDMSLDQATRQHKGIALGPMVFRPAANFPEKPAEFLVNGCVVGYGRSPEHEQGWWRRSKNWTRRDERVRRPVVAAVIRAASAAVAP